MKSRFLEAGQIVNTHGIQGEVKIVPWGDSPEFLCGFDTFYIDGAPVKVRAARAHKGNVLARLEGVDDVNAAMRLRNKVVQIDRTGVILPEGRHFIADLIGLTAIDDDTGAELGVVADVLTLPTHEVYVVEGQGKTYMVPAVDAFLRGTDVDAGWVRLHLIEGMDV
ncbi:ribosome maturation factor RimM [Pseudoflavonifractor sp. MSJ-37]|uniref:ribosome maturation factor RimM n=1 Tax=Pseudoflavonifractor sp. MSJ-37 TaxID=2841531 RepID=UPI001C1277E1|nr:ribosome maturation factor RimM [Pseudoflavonifractor sp. MSJ-37]MBU5434882.1 ribosome maturation factor RimM [Pseudoflavonifractor sp. MSJ-37]